MVMMMMMVMVMTLLFIPKIELLFSHRQHCRLSNFTFFLILRRLPQPPESGCRISPNLAKLEKTAFFAKNPSPRYFLIGKFFQMRVDFLQVRMTLWHMPSLILSVFCPMIFHFLSENGFSHIFSTLSNQHGRRWPFLNVVLTCTKEIWNMWCWRNTCPPPELRKLEERSECCFPMRMKSNSALKQILVSTSPELSNRESCSVTLKSFLDTLWQSWVNPSCHRQASMYVGGLISRFQWDSVSFQRGGVPQRFYIRSRGVATLVSPSETNPKPIWWWGELACLGTGET